jgi:membrane-associated phospholipid phosphatase
VPRPQTTVENVAHWISQIGSPPVMGLLSFILTIIQLSTPHVWVWAILHPLFAMISPLAFLMWQVRRGHVTDMDVHFRQQRKWSLLVTIAGFVLSWITMQIGGAPPALLMMAGMGIVQWLAIYLITLRWKISVHSASISGVTLFMVWSFGTTVAPLALIIPLVAWSRVKLRRHTPAQVVAGILLGCVAFSISLGLSPTLQTPGFLTR